MVKQWPFDLVSCISDTCFIILKQNLLKLYRENPMKKVFLFIILMAFASVSLAGDWGIGSDGDTTTQEVNFYEAPEKKTSNDIKKGNGLANGEATWNLDFEGLSFVMPDQPANDQFVTTITGLGVTYKFSDRIHLAAKVVQYELEGKKGSNWKHQHILGGVGMRDFFAQDTQQLQVNFLTGTSEVSEDDLGKMKNLEPPVFIDLKYLWIFGESFFVGPEITFARVANSCDEINGTTMECGTGGYAAFGLTFQIGMPDKWGK